MRLLLLMTLFFLSQATFALGCDKAITTPDINECAATEQNKVEVKLNEKYKNILQKLEDTKSGDVETKKALIEAQRAWVKFREADCNALYTYYRDGTIRTVMHTGCMQNHAEQRMKELKEYELSQ
jgi:uncharacterized protein YecT (DUF1311 family)